MWQWMARRAGGRLSILGVSLALIALLPLAGCAGNANAGTQCGGGATSRTTAPSVADARALAAAQAAAPRTPQALASLTIGLTYVANIQFAPFYVADALGYYRGAGLNVTLHHHGASEDEFGTILAGREDAIFAGGDEVLQADSRGAPLVYIAQVYTKYPVALMVPASSPVRALAQLKGCTIGIPGKYGATYIGLLALLHSANLTQSDVHIQSIGYTQVSALLTHKVDAVMGYLNNEAVQFRQAHFGIRTFAASDVQPLISNGLATTQAELSAHPDLMRAVVAATLRGLTYTIAHPQDAVRLSEPYVTGLNDATQQSAALAVLNATIPLWQSSGPQPGYTDPTAWQSMASFLQAQGQLGGPVNATTTLSNAYLPLSG
jgi:NitT/TauT family transport system substrate-binding protein